MAVYIHLIRAKDDPERQDIRKVPEHLRDRAAAWRRSLSKTSPAQWREPILALLADGVPRTFNRVGVELLDKTADVLFGEPPDAALWELVEEGLVEHTLEAPVLFRGAVSPAAGSCAATDPGYGRTSRRRSRSA